VKSTRITFVKKESSIGEKYSTNSVVYGKVEDINVTEGNAWWVATFGILKYA